MLAIRLRISASNLVSLLPIKLLHFIDTKVALPHCVSATAAAARFWDLHLIQVHEVRHHYDQVYLKHASQSQQA